MKKLNSEEREMTLEAWERAFDSPKHKLDKQIQRFKGYIEAETNRAHRQKLIAAHYELIMKRERLYGVEYDRD